MSEEWNEERKTKDSAFNRRIDSVRSTHFRLAALQQQQKQAQPQQRDWDSGVFTARTMTDNQAAHKSDPFAIPSEYQSGQFAARPASAPSPAPVSSSYHSGHFAKADDSLSTGNFSQQRGYGTGQNTPTPVSADNSGANSTLTPPSSAQSLMTFSEAMANSPYAPKSPAPVLSAEKLEVAPLTNQEIDARAFFDPQTQAYNFRYILRRLEHELARAKYFERSVAVLVISIDTIKRMPADWGQNPIDKALDLVAATLFSNSRPFDLIGRYTDDRFVLICPESSLTEVTKIAESIRDACSVLQVKHQWQDLRLSVSIGIAISSTEFEDVESLIAIADVGADTVTQNGGNGYCFGADTL